MLTSKEIRMVLEALREKYGPGYSDEPGVGALQAKLSMMLEMAVNQESKEKPSDENQTRP